MPGAAPSNPNLEAFAARGGKMISFHGWNDEIVPVQATIDYWDSVGRYMGAGARDRFYKLYLATGMDHCRGGAGPDNFGFFGEESPEPPTPQNDMLAAMVDWVEQGREPGSLVASKLVDGKVTMSRPVCAWPPFIESKVWNSITLSWLENWMRWMRWAKPRSASFKNALCCMWLARELAALCWYAASLPENKPQNTLNATHGC